MENEIKLTGGNLVDAISQTRQKHLDRCWPQIKALAGKLADQLWSSRESVYELMKHVLPEVRAAVIICGSAKWDCGRDPLFQQFCIEAVRSESGELHEIAITELSHIFYGSKNRMAESALISVIRDETRSAYVRNHAYRALREVEFGFDYDTIQSRSDEITELLNKRPVPLMQFDWRFIEAIEDCVDEMSG